MNKNLKIILIIFILILILIMFSIIGIIIFKQLNNTNEPNTNEPNTNEPNTNDPNTNEPNTNEQGSWTTSEWSECNALCEDNGTQEREITCVDLNNDIVTNCDESIKPNNIKNCSGYICPLVINEKNDITFTFKHGSGLNTGYVYNFTTLENCKDSCEENGNCLAFGYNENEKICHIYTNKDEYNKDASGWKFYTKKLPNNLNNVSGQNLYITKDVNNIDECALSCNNNNICTAYAFNDNVSTNNCQLYENLFMSDNPGWIYNRKPENQIRQSLTYKLGKFLNNLYK